MENVAQKIDSPTHIWQYFLTETPKSVQAI